MMMMMMMMIIIIIIIIIVTSPRPGNNFPRDQEIPGWCQAGDSLISCRGGSSLALLGNPSRDGDSIKILVWRHLKPNAQLLRVNYVY